MDVLTVGLATFDIIYQVDTIPGVDEKIWAKDKVLCGGGPAANAAVACSRLGVQSAFCGYLGDDIFGGLHLSELFDEQIDTSLVVRGTEETPLCSILVDGAGYRTIIAHRPSNYMIPASAIDLPTKNPKVLLFDGHQLDVSKKLIRFAKNNNIQTVLDAGSVNEGTLGLINEVDFVVASAKFARQYTDIPDQNQAFQKLAQRVNCLVVTYGCDGLKWKTLEGDGSLTAYPVKATDTTGAGDCFHGAFLYGLVENLSWIELLTFASKVAAISCTTLGGRVGFPSLEVARSFS